MRRIFVVLIFVFAFAAGGVFLWARMEYAAPGPQARQGDKTVVLVKPGEGVGAIAQDLADAGVIKRPTLFRWMVRFEKLGHGLKAGEYAIPSKASMQDIVGILIAGKSILHKLTVPEGFTSQMAYALVKADPVLTGDAGPVPAEGSLLPETYLFTRGTTRKELFRRMEAAQKKLIAKLWPKRAKNLPVSTPEQAIILASIVEKESALPAERRHIAAVFENRLRRGMKLQSDPTIIYGLTKGYPLGHGIRESELNRATPYNTYMIPGLPPTPICNPGKDSIAAVLDPVQSDDLYFVADGTGGHVFAATMRQHRKNVARWRHIERTEKSAVSPPPRPRPKRHTHHRRHTHRR